MKARKGTPIEGQRRETAATEENLLSPGQAHEGEITRYVGNQMGRRGREEESSREGEVPRFRGTVFYLSLTVSLPSCLTLLLSHYRALLRSCSDIILAPHSRTLSSSDLPHPPTLVLCQPMTLLLSCLGTLVLLGYLIPSLSQDSANVLSHTLALLPSCTLATLLSFCFIILGCSSIKFLIPYEFAR